MAFNKGYELKKFEAHWEKLRIEYAAAGMTDDAIQKMYDYDRQQFNSERTCIERTQEFTAPAYESSEEEASPLMLRYQEAIIPLSVPLLCSSKIFPRMTASLSPLFPKHYKKKKHHVSSETQCFVLVENTGIEPVTSCMPCKRSPS